MDFKDLVSMLYVDTIMVDIEKVVRDEISVFVMHLLEETDYVLQI